MQKNALHALWPCQTAQMYNKWELDDEFGGYYGVKCWAVVDEQHSHQSWLTIWGQTTINFLPMCALVHIPSWIVKKITNEFWTSDHFRRMEILLGWNHSDWTTNPLVHPNWMCNSQQHIPCLKTVFVLEKDDGLGIHERVTSNYSNHINQVTADGSDLWVVLCDNGQHIIALYFKKIGWYDVIWLYFIFLNNKNRVATHTL